MEERIFGALSESSSGRTPIGTKLSTPDRVTMFSALTLNAHGGHVTVWKNSQNVEITPNNYQILTKS
jgi:hypothetical protein